MTLKSAVILLLLFGYVHAANGRVTRSLSYDDLITAADLVAIIEPISTEDAKDAYSGYSYGHLVTDFQAHNTSFKVHAILKGSASAVKPLIVLHFSYSKIIPITNGARFACFVPGPLEYKKIILKDKIEIGGVTFSQQIPAWLAFMKMRDDGRFEPVTDPYDAADSFRELHESSFFIP